MTGKGYVHCLVRRSSCRCWGTCVCLHAPTCALHGSWLQVEFYTGTSRGAGTDANVSFELSGDRLSNGKPVTSGVQRVAAGLVSPAPAMRHSLLGALCASLSRPHQQRYKQRVWGVDAAGGLL